MANGTDWPEITDFDLHDQAVWDRLPGESTKHYAVFRIYRDMPPISRTVRAAGAQAGLAESTVAELSSKWLWRARADAWDDECHQTEDHERLEAIRQMHKLHRNAGRLAVGKAMQALNSLAPSEMNPAQIARMLAIGTKLERDTLLTSVEELQGLDDEDDEGEDPWERIARELTPDDDDALDS